MSERLMREAILALKGMADAESQGCPDIYCELLDAYHASYDASWMPQGYGMTTRDRSIPIVIDMSKIPELESGRGEPFTLLSTLSK